METSRGITICPSLPVSAVTPYECYVSQYSPFGLFVLEHYLRCRDRIWSQAAASVERWACHAFPKGNDEVNYFWEQLHERCSCVWDLIAVEERVRFVGLSVSFRILSEQARLIGKRLFGILRDDRLGFDLEDMNGHPNNSALVFDPSFRNQGMGSASFPGVFPRPLTREVATMTDPVTIRSPLESSTGAFGTKKAHKRIRRRAPDRDQTPKRIRTAYMMFMASEGVRIRKELPTDIAEPGALGKYMGQLWKSMSEDEKEPYIEMARQDKERYNNEVLVKRQRVTVAPDVPKPETITSGSLNVQRPLETEPTPFFYSQVDSSTM